MIDTEHEIELKKKIFTRIFAGLEVSEEETTSLKRIREIIKMVPSFNESLTYYGIPQHGVEFIPLANYLQEWGVVISTNHNGTLYANLKYKDAWE